MTQKYGLLKSSRHARAYFSLHKQAPDAFRTRQKDTGKSMRPVLNMVWSSIPSPCLLNLVEAGYSVFRQVQACGEGVEAPVCTCRPNDLYDAEQGVQKHNTSRRRVVYKYSLRLVLLRRRLYIYKIIACDQRQYHV